MFDPGWLTTDTTAVVMIFVSAAGLYAALLVFTRLLGVRSFSKMSPFDFAITVAFGSILASVVVAKDPPLLQGVAALAALFGIQGIVASLRPRFTTIRQTVDNEPILVVAHGEVLPDNLEKAQMTRADLHAKLREANVFRWRDAHAVVVETTGDVSVLHGEDPTFDHDLFDGVRGADQLG